MNDSDSRVQSAPPLDDARISGAINKILENPELIGMIGSMLTSQKQETETAADAPDAEPLLQAASV